MEHNKYIHSQRLDYVDILRGVGILYMIIGHVGFGWIIDKYIHAFHMPLFLFISGYFFKPSKYSSHKEFIKTKAKTLLLPYIYFGLIHYGIWVLFIGIKQNLNLTTYLTNLFWMNTSGEMPIVGALWFLTCLYLVEVLCFFLTNVLKRNWLLALVIVIVSIAGCLIPQYSNIRLPYALDVAMVGTGIFYAGNVMKKYSQAPFVAKWLDLGLLKTGILFIICSALIFTNGYVNMRTADYSFIYLFYINAIIGTLVYWNLCKLSVKYFCNFVNHSCKALLYIGKNSIIFLCLNQLVILLFKKILTFVPVESTIMLLLNSTFILISTIVVLIVLTEVITKTKLKFLIGRQW